MRERRSGDRRQQDTPVLTDRRHGERRTYQAGCTCTPCRAAEAAYRADLRRRHLMGVAIMGGLVAAAETWRQLRLLQTEYLTASALAGRLGLHRRDLKFDRHRVRRSTAVRVQRLYQQDILSGLGPDRL